MQVYDDAMMIEEKMATDCGRIHPIFPWVTRCEVPDEKVGK